MRRRIRRPAFRCIARNRSTKAETRGSVFHAARLTISRALTCMMTSFSTSPLDFNVPPVDTRSTIRPASPLEGASSIAPFSLMHSAWMPCASKYRLVMLGYLVATRRWLALPYCIPPAPSARRWKGGSADAKVHRRVKLRIIEFLDHVGADDADLRCAKGDEGGDIESAHAQDAHGAAVSSAKLSERSSLS